MLTVDAVSVKSHKPTLSTGERLKSAVESAFPVVMRENRLILRAGERTITPQQVCEYLDNIFYLIQHTPILLRIARFESLNRGMRELADFYYLKIDEEKGHEAWATADVEAISSKFGIVPSLTISKHMKALVDGIRSAIETDPTLYLAYIMLAEHMTVLVAPAWLEMLDQCGIPKTAMSSIGNHAELDKEHVVEMVEVIDRFGGDPKYLSPFLDLIDRQLQHHTAFCNEIADCR